MSDPHNLLHRSHTWLCCSGFLAWSHENDIFSIEFRRWQYNQVKDLHNKGIPNMKNDKWTHRFIYIFVYTSSTSFTSSWPYLRHGLPPGVSRVVNSNLQRGMMSCCHYSLHAICTAFKVFYGPLYIFGIGCITSEKLNNIKIQRFHYFDLFNHVTLECWVQVPIDKSMIVCYHMYICLNSFSRVHLAVIFSGCWTLISC